MSALECFEDQRPFSCFDRKCSDRRHTRKIVSNYLIHPDDLDDHPDDPDERYIKTDRRQTTHIIQNSDALHNRPLRGKNGSRYSGQEVPWNAAKLSEAPPGAEILQIFTLGIEVSVWSTYTPTFGPQLRSLVSGRKQWCPDTKLRSRGPKVGVYVDHLLTLIPGLKIGRISAPGGDILSNLAASQGTGPFSKFLVPILSSSIRNVRKWQL